MDWPESRGSQAPPEEVAHAKKVPLYKLPESQNLRINMLWLLMGPVILWKTIRGAKLIFRVAHDKSQKLSN